MSQTQTNHAPTRTPPPMPLWVKVLGIIIIAAVVIFAVTALAGVQHGPNLHNPSMQSTHHP